MTMPIYFATDWDVQPSQMAQIDAYLQGCATVLGKDRVGVYGGWAVIDHCSRAGTAAWFWQTIAWEYGRGLHPAAHLYQYDYNIWIAGTNCDATQALKPHYGQASDYLNQPAPEPVPAPTPKPKPPAYPKPELPSWWAGQKKLGFPVNRHWRGVLWEASRGKSTVIRDTSQRLTASDRGKKAGPDLNKGDVVLRERVFTASDGKQWVVLRDGGHGKDGARVLHADLADTPEDSTAGNTAKKDKG
jgi:hypothetical protein